MCRRAPGAEDGRVQGAGDIQMSVLQAYPYKAKGMLTILQSL